MSRSLAMRLCVILSALFALSAITGCGGNMRDLEDYVASEKRKPGGRVEPLPPVKPYFSHEYESYNERSPFQPDDSIVDTETTAVAGGVSPDAQRNREFLEEFPLDTLRMVGTLSAGGQFFGLVQTSDGLVHRVRDGNYMGQNHGKVQSISDSEIVLTEIISDGLGGFIERPASVALSE